MSASSLVVALWMVWAGPLRPGEVGDSARTILADDAYAFCHETDFPLTHEEAKWCPVLAGNSPRCPALVEACKAPRGELDYPSGGRQASGRRVLTKKVPDGDAKTREESDRSSTANGTGFEPGETDNGASETGETRNPESSSGEQQQTSDTSASQTGETDGPASTGDASETPNDEPETSEGSGGSEPETKTPTKKSDRELRRKRDQEPKEPLARPNETQSSLGAVFFWIVLIGGALAILVLLLRQRVGLVDEDSAEIDEDKETAVEDENLAEASKPLVGVLRDVDALLTRAEQVGAAGDYGQAIRDCHAALLRSLEHADLITIVRSRTNGEYVRDLAGRAELQGRVRAVMGDVEQAQFGTQAPDKDIFSRVLGRVREVVRSGLSTILLVATAATVAFACTQGSRGEWKTYSWSHGPAGNAGLVELARIYDISLTERSAPLEMLEDKTSTLILMAGADPEPKQWELLEDWVNAGGRLIVTGGVGRLPEWVGARHRYRSGDVLELSVAEAYWPEFGRPTLRVPGGDRLDVDGARPMLLADSDVYAAYRQPGRGQIVTLANDALLTNAALTTDDDAAFTLALLQFLGGSAEYIDGSSWAGTNTPFEAIGRTELLPALLQALALLLLLYLWRGVLFGAPRDPARKSRRAFAQHVEAVGTHYARARASRHALRLYASWAMGQLRDRARAGQRKGLLPLAQTLAERSGRDETEIMRILVEAHAATQESLTHDDPGRGDLEDLKLMRELAKLVVRAGGAR